MKEDPIFKERFGITTKIQYVHELTVEPRLQKTFEKAWKKEWKGMKPNHSLSRREKFDAFLRRIENDQDDARYCNRVEIRYIDKKVGYGVFATKRIGPYSILNQYGGLFRPDKEIALNNDSAFMFTDFSRFTIDGKIAGNWTRFMNHADEETGTVNVLAWEHYSKRGPRIIFTSGRHGIDKGEQLLYSYGEEYWEQKKALKL